MKRVIDRRKVVCAVGLAFMVWAACTSSDNGIARPAKTSAPSPCERVYDGYTAHVYACRLPEGECVIAANVHGGPAISCRWREPAQ